MTSLNPGESRATQIEGIALVTVATIVWGSGGLFTRLLPFDLWTIVFWRGVFATLFIGAYVLYRFGRSTLKVVLDAGFEGVLVSLCSTATIVLFPAAFLHTSVANAFTRGSLSAMATGRTIRSFANTSITAEQGKIVRPV